MVFSQEAGKPLGVFLFLIGQPSSQQAEEASCAVVRTNAPLCRGYLIHRGTHYVLNFILRLSIICLTFTFMVSKGEDKGVLESTKYKRE